MEIFEVVYVVLSSLAIITLGTWQVVQAKRAKPGSWIEVVVRELPPILGQLGSLLNTATETYRITQQVGGMQPGKLENSKLELSRLKAGVEAELENSRLELREKALAWKKEQEERELQMELRQQELSREKLALQRERTQIAKDRENRLGGRNGSGDSNGK